MYQISVAGHFCVDLTPQLPAWAGLTPGQLFDIGPLGVKLGGCVANTGLSLLDLGADVELQGTVGDDWLGTLGTQLLAAASEGRWAPDIVAGAGTSYSIVVEPGGADRTFWHHTGVNAIFDAARVRTDTDLLHFGYPPLLPSVVLGGPGPLVSLFERAHLVGATTSLDLAVVDPDGPVGKLDWGALLDAILAVADVVSPSVDDLRSMLPIDAPPSLELAQELSEELLRRGAAVALVTAGEHGLVLRAGGAERLRRGGRVLAALAGTWAGARVVAPPLQLDGIATSTGAGDAASAGLLYGLAAGLTPADSVALTAAASVVVMSGDRPTPSAVAKFDPGLARLFGTK
ncbi:MAG: carbohydrate kinase family protein [Propionibacteriaceae bacterium]|jgi:sugar/nucleoside kinase (ribokinase family)|nr:carbohydrate kinase family protein [Propionibacteriaceae bacterium]